MKRPSWLILIVVGVVLALYAYRRGKPDNEILGIWKVVWRQTNGQPKHRDRELWAVRPDRLTVVRDDNISESQLLVDASQSPKHFDSTGIYEIHGQDMRVCQSVFLLDQPRPTEFETKWGDLRTLTVLSRCSVTDSRLTDAELKELLVREFGPPKEPLPHHKPDKDAETFVDNLMRNITGNESEKHRVVWNISWLITEVDNGGFHQFLFNSSGDNAVQTAIDLRTIGASKTASMVESACRLFPGGKPALDLKGRRLQLDKFTLDQLEALRDLEEQFYSRDEDLHLLLKKYWERSP